MSIAKATHGSGSMRIMTELRIALPGTGLEQTSSREQAIEEIDEIVDDAELDKSESFKLNNGSMSIGTPQLIIVAMMLFNLGFVAAKHGKNDQNATDGLL